MQYHRFAYAIIAALLFVGCGGGSGSSGSSVPSNGTGATGGVPSTTQSVALNINIPAATTGSSVVRKPAFVSASTQGVLVVVYLSSDTGHTSPVGTAAQNVAPGSTACGGAQGARTCTITIPAPSSTDDFVFKAYDQPPNTGTTTFPGNANLLSTGTVFSQTIHSGTVNTVNVTLGGTVASLRVVPTGTTALIAGPNGTANAGNYPLEETAFDIDNNAIIGTYATPIAVTLTEPASGACVTIAPNDCASGWTGHAGLSLTGTAPSSSSVSLTASNQIVSVLYDGLGNPMYYASLQFQSGSATVSTTFAPMFEDSVAPQFASGVPGIVTFTQTTDSALIDLRQAGGTGFTVSQGNCAGVASATAPAAVAGSTSYESSTITPLGTTGGSCTITYSVGNASWPVTVNYGGTTSSLVVPGVGLAYIAQGAAGINMYTKASLVGTIPTSTPAEFLVLDDSGNLYVFNGTNLNKYTPNTAYPPAYTLSGATYTFSQPVAQIAGAGVSGAGELVVYYINDTTGLTTYDEWDPGQTGSASRTFSLQPYQDNWFNESYISHDGHIYTAVYVQCNGTSTCLQYDIYPPGSATPVTFMESLVSPIPNPQTVPFFPNYISVAPNGTIYATEYSNSNDPYRGLYVYGPNGSPETFISSGAEYPQQLGLDDTGNIYIVNDTTITPTTTPVIDTAKNIAVLTPGGQLLHRISGGGMIDAGPLLVTGTGGLYYTDNAYPSLGLAGGVLTIGASQTTPSQLTGLQPTDGYAEWDGVSETNPASNGRRTLSTAGAAGGGNFVIRRH